MAIQPSVRAQGTFDRLSFVKYVKNIGRAYRKQATELISICRTFVQAQLQDFCSHDELTSVLQVVDDALKSAATEKKASKEVDEKFKNAIDRLSIYERDHHSKDTVIKTMGAAKGKATSSSSILSKLKEKVLPMKVEPTRTVEFHLHKSLPDKNPTIVKQVLCRSSSLEEILWNFSRFKDEKMRLTIKQNPHFYEVLPTRPDAYGDGFRIDPIETFQRDKICVLTDNLGQTGRVFLDITDRKRAFGNVWLPKKAIIFKDVCGKLEGESIVGAAINDTINLWYFEEPPLSHASRPALSPNGNGPSPTVSVTSRSSVGVPIQDWREPIRRMLQSLDVNIRITTKPPINISPSPSVPPAGSSGSASKPLPIVLPPLRSPIRLKVPAQSAGPLTPSSYRTARTTPLSQRSPAAELSPKTRTPLSPALPPVLPSQPSSSSVALPVPHLPHLPTVALTLTERATPAPPTARTLPGTSQSRESQRIALSLPSPVALSVPLPGQPPTVVSSLTQRGVPAPPTYILPDGPQGRKSQEVPLPPFPRMAASVLHPKQPTTVASPSPGRAIPQPSTVHILPEISLSRETQTVVVPQAEAQVSSPVPIAGLPSSVLNVTIVSPWQIINTSKHKLEDHEGEFVDYVHIQAPVPSPINGGVTSTALDFGVVSPSPPVQAPAIVPPARDQLNVQKKNWFRKYLWDYKK